MRTLVVLDAKRLARWHGWLISRLAADARVELHVALSDVPATARPGAALEMLLSGERLLDRRRLSASDPITAAELGHRATAGPFPAGDFDVVLDLTWGVARVPAAGRVIRPTFDGDPSEAALWSALLERRSPLLGLDLGEAKPRPAALPAVEHPTRLRRSADQVLSRLIQVLAIAALEGPNALPQAPVPCAVKDHTDAGAVAAADFAWRKVARKTERALSRLLGTRERWRVAWRLAPEGRSHLAGLAPAEAYRTLPDDGQRYFADPFPMLRDGLHHVFAEEVPFQTGRGLISHFTVDASGRATAPRPVLETRHHLSYPQVFAHEGQIYMMPECSASGALDVYRADPFPHRWVPAFRLLDEEVHDATLAVHAGAFYLFASTRDLQSSSWDALNVYRSEKLEGPWQPVSVNPALIDARESRPAGALYHRDGALWRPAQNCSASYGGSLSLARVTRLDAAGFAQELAADLRMPGRPAGHGPHTINWADGLEVIDFLA